MFSTVVSDVCPDTSKVNFTIKCNFEDCYIPGEYCDRSDSDFYRCAKCDEDVCNGGNVPGECKIPCLGEYVIKKKGGGEYHTVGQFHNVIEKSLKEVKSIPTKKTTKTCPLTLVTWYRCFNKKRQG
jgi:hypothetical protein